MRWSMSLVQIAVMLVALLVAAPAAAQPAPSPTCPAGQVYDPGQSACVPDPDAPDDGATETPGLPPIEIDNQDETLEDIARDQENIDGGNILGLTLRHYACDAGVDPRQDVAAWEVACAGAGKPAFTYTFTIRNRFATSVTLQTGDGTRGEATLESTREQRMPEGAIVIAVDPVAGWTADWVVCTIEAYHGEQRTLELPISDGAVSLDLTLGDTAACAWFNIATGDEGQDAGPGDGQGIVADAPETFAPGLAIAARLCPPEVAGQEVAVEEVCTEPATGISFEIGVDGEDAGTFVTDAAGGFVLPVELGPGQYEFRHQPSPDQLELRTVCFAVYANGSTATGRSSMTGSDMGQIYLAYDGVSNITCTFYFVMDSAAVAPVEQATPEVGERQAVTGAHILAPLA